MVDFIMEKIFFPFLAFGALILIGFFFYMIYDYYHPDKILIIETQKISDTNHFRCWTGYLFLIEKGQVMGDNGKPLHCKYLEEK